MGSYFGIGGVRAGLRRMAAYLPQLSGALAAGLFAGAFEPVDGSAGAVVLSGYLIAGWYSARADRWRWLLPMAGLLSRATFPILGTAATLAIALVFDETISALGLLIAAAAGLAVLILAARLVEPKTRIRLGVIGSPRQAMRLQEELSGDRSGGFEVAATIVPDDWDFDPAALQGPYLSSLSAIGRAIDERDLEALVVTHEFTREEVDSRLYAEVITRPVQLMDLAEFHEHRFGSVPLAEIDYAWFTRLAGRHYRPVVRVTKRAVDLLVAIPVGLLLAVPVAILALAVRRDGGPAIYRQARIGQGGTEFQILKLRTMTHDSDRVSSWTEDDDERITGLGAFLRRSHLDEAPQLWNVIRGDMSLVGPRPEQGFYVDELSRAIPFYPQRHLIKPGITGWAQVRVGYAGSLEGTTFKLCNDLYYMKHHTLSLDLAIGLETLRTLVADRQYVEPPSTSLTMLGKDEIAD